ncbi:hypothetical protein AM202_04387 [Actinobacillus minor 202]|uniref:Uncharacterized protein n=1 Tax=Actinobacillus minor 202 TaxID=591023 RepID=A0ABM9YVR4_9PAST|nr:hypothetical protein AM202_04387 [Actinobacillus minor 202]
MNNEIEITTKFCHPYMNFGGDGCNDIILRVPQSEAVKLQTVEHSSSFELGTFEMSYFSSGMGLVLFCYVFAFAIGQVIKQVR